MPDWPQVRPATRSRWLLPHPSFQRRRQAPSASSLSTGSQGWLLPQAPLGFTHLPTDSLVLQPPRATFTRDNKGLKSSQRCHLDHLDQCWTTQRPTVPGTCKSKPSHVADTGHVWLLSTGMWPVALRSQNTHFNSI